ncbi:DUF3325 domain-containing protein [Belnapia rosea]|uniref:DUF3325 domain-containing protein n=1 Tax=Belnapia rosea TaxID=938405 RepID=A0A1G7CPQ0_9PROT|nr:DUF3325 domain-containing protein [Belnapia rosea]SDB74044.1 Protein of unknown function [Belnapia rosea]SDE41318.1 Protein of unknown function [Belnapia rosea]
MMLLALALPYAGFTALCLAMERHHEQVLGRRRIAPGLRRLLRLAGWLLLLASPLPCLALAGWGGGSVLWCGMLTAAALLLTLSLPYAPRLAAALALALPALGLVLAS